MAMQIPLQVRLKREVHRRIAFAQDIMVREVYAVFGKAVMHGETAIWRCYQGQRFSEDLDFYLPNDSARIDELFSRFVKAGFKIQKRKVSDRSIFSELLLDRISVRFEATFQNITGVLCDYESSDGNIIPIYSLTPESFLKEKTNTYLKRHKVRDLWDVFFLLKKISNISCATELAVFISKYSPPEDEKDLKAILFEGIVPSAEEMIAYIKRKWENKYT